MSEFHFIRPEWFLALIPAILLVLILRYRQSRGSAWEKTIDAELLPYLLENAKQSGAGVTRWLLLLGWTLAITALAGPVWQQTPQPVHEREDALVIVLDLTRSMYATDAKPNRLVRARRKLLDLLATRTEGTTALVVYAGDAHLVSPLTDDAKTIAELVPAVSPDIMPAPGSQLAPAITMAHQLFKDAGIASGRILILTDEIRDVAQAQSVARSHRYAYPVSVMAVGKPEGAPILAPGEGYIRDGNGGMVIPQVDYTALAEFAAVAGGRFSPMTLLENDLDYLLAEQPLDTDESFRETDRDFDIWYEEGPWLLLLLLPLAALGFRRGWLWQVTLVAMLPWQEVHASLWDDLWWNGNQQGQKLLEANAPAQAAEKFTDPEWRGTAHYKAADFAAAADTFAELEHADGRYNLGNALAKSGQYEAAIAAYDEALAKDPNHEDARFNKQLVEELLKQQEQQQQEGEGEDQQNSENQDNNQSQDASDQSEESGEQEQNGQPEDNEQADQQEAEQQQQAEQQQGEEQPASDQQFSEADSEPLSEEEQQALEQWLRKVPDDPGGLLRRKFEMQFQERLKQGDRTNNDSSNW
jgi:Ca-activated chloride channel family protein